MIWVVLYQLIILNVLIMSKLVSEIVELLWVSRLGNSIQQKLRHVVIRRFRSKQIVLFDFSWRNWFNFCVSGHFFLTSFSINHFDGNIWVEVFPFLTKKSSELKKNLRQLFFSREPWAPIYLDSRKNELWIHEEKSLLGIVIWTKFNLRSEFWKRNSTNEGFKELKMWFTCSQFSLDAPSPFALLKTISKWFFFSAQNSRAYVILISRGLGPG